jgi:hypothetical protein
MNKLASLLAVTLLMGTTESSIAVRSGQEDAVRGDEFAAAVNLPPRDVKVEGTLFLPRAVTRVHAVLVVIRFGLGGNSCCYYDPQWRKLAERSEAALLLVRFSSIASDSTAAPWRDAEVGGAEALLLLLQRLAVDSRHPGLQNAPLLFWGHSAAGPFGTTFAALHPDRTLGFIRYHSGNRGPDPSVLREIPALFLRGAKDTVVGVNTGEAYWKSGRAAGAPWTWALEPDATHGEVSDAEKANALVIPWVEAVFRLRLDGEALRAVSVESAWLGDNGTGETAPYDAFTGLKVNATWLPDEETALGWRKVTGPG